MPSIRPLLLSSALALCCTLPAYAKETPLPIGQVQGSQARSALVGQTVTVTGTVTADLRAGLQGFFVQDAGDGDAATSDALWVVAGAGGALPDIHTGQRWQLTGTVAETGDGPHTLTTLQLADAKALRAAIATPAPVVLTAPPADWAALEGMRVRIDAPLTLNGTDMRFGQTIGSFGGPLWTPSEREVPGTPGYAALAADNAHRRLLLDDGSDARDPAVLPYLPGGAVRSGSTATGASGVVDFRHGAWRLQALTPLQVQAAARPAAPDVPGSVRIAVFNLENLFNGDGAGGGFPTKRGAKTEAEYRAQVARLVATLTPLRADIAALMELENDGYGPQSSLAQFVEALNAAGGDWRYIDAGSGPGDNPIRVGLIYRASRVTPVGRPVTLEGGPFVEHSRVPLAQAFRRGDGALFVVAANHFKSKGCNEASGGDADAHDGAGCWNATRTESARRVDAWLKSDPTGTGATRALIVGDLNAYAQEQPLRTLRQAGWADAFAAAHVAAPYSYVYDGQRGRLDHALLSPALAPLLRGAAEWHVNADEPEPRGDARDATPGPWRSSDHDPMLLGFDL
ncbi:ExeM/NucH family extracellular endonuclease [Pseudoxanthomonas winnipegensis]|uniref:ExeM/NucH family extracellular endonuclease n=1 Tax=Pseudoxanthomonas winnipegensis TaxID=2480810 RepID=A0A4Q8LQ52_9GAMM|nr:ExeM/NucH family extracellular endonuclease [Pseudoxanthomonas winnipegensis]RZZ89643.1 ExeM/NucH family extracellular endonuclease [Pseudoxanthomonas winnipegensis]TAA32916.1 ExeM/NucH family extracellular endonuclease [Pseudoxanthomonas winnipegensis]TAA43160.1 ExeM/NucH family extracellular endonuclease [Pseudoxanthomonas winnipegensis]TBV78601.1 ExeM/NucH family extracellular endonuclease [Pseudoxanthomonas winnipegensis]